MSSFLGVARMRGKTLPLVLTAIVAAIPAVAVDPVLIYSDRSAGTHAIEYAVSQNALQSGPGVEVKRDVAAFSTALNESAGSEVWVIARYTTTPPVYFEALRDFAIRTGRRVQFFLWNDAGQSISAGQDVYATHAIAAWLVVGPVRATSIVYSDPYTEGQQQKDTRLITNLVWPTFDDVSIRHPQPISNVTWLVSGNPALVAYSADDSCVSKCILDFLVAQEKCDEDNVARYALCEDIHSDPEEFQALVDCKKQSDVFHGHCLDLAMWTYRYCLRRCPSTPPPGGIGG